MLLASAMFLLPNIHQLAAIKRISDMALMESEGKKIFS